MPGAGASRYVQQQEKRKITPLAMVCRPEQVSNQSPLRYDPMQDKLIDQIMEMDPVSTNHNGPVD